VSAARRRRGHRPASTQSRLLRSRSLVQELRPEIASADLVEQLTQISRDIRARRYRVPTETRAVRGHHELIDVFKESGVPRLTFVEPDDFYDLRLALAQPGRGVVIEGPSGVGKTTALQNATRVCLELLVELAAADNGVLSLRELRTRRRELRPGIDRLLRERLLERMAARHPLPPLLAAAADGGCKVLPLLVRPSLFEDTPELSRYQTVNGDGRTLADLTSSEADAVLVRLAQSVAKLARPHE
jgi:hypothetical protein